MNPIMRQISPFDDLFLQLLGPDQEGQWNVGCVQKHGSSAEDILDKLSVITGNLEGDPEMIANELGLAVSRIYQEVPPQTAYCLRNPQIEGFMKKFQKQPLSAEKIWEAAQEVLSSLEPSSHAEEEKEPPPPREQSRRLRRRVAHQSSPPGFPSTPPVSEQPRAHPNILRRRPPLRRR